MAQRTRPQLASAPNMAAFSRLEQMTLFATILALRSSLPPVTLHSSSLVAPSPSPAILRHRSTVTVFRACMKVVKSSPSAVISWLPARPLARTVTISLVEVSPSTLTMLKVLVMSPDRAFCSMLGAMAQSVVMKTSMVAMLGWIIPEPLAMPPMWQVLPPTVNSTAISFLTVSVVMMPTAAASPPSVDRPATSSSMPPAMGSRFRGWPMTPVEATTTSVALTPVALATSSHMASAISMPLALQVLALPELQMTAWAMPSAMLFLVTVRGAPLTRLVV